MSISDHPTGPIHRELKIGGRLVRTTAAFDTYWRFASARQEVFFNRIAQKQPPWTTDPIIAAHRFTNVYRAADRVSQYLIKNVIYDSEQQNVQDVFFRIVLFKLFNRIETWETLCRAVGGISWRTYDFHAYNHCLDKLFQSGGRVYSAAYIMPSPSFSETRKHANHLRLIEHMMADGAPRKVAAAKSLADVFRLLRGYNSLGDFLAFQLAIDLNYSPLIDFSEMEFIVAGPGARDGISKCFTGLAGIPAEDVIRFMAEHADLEFNRLGLSFATLWGRPLQLIDCQNIFCELSKYARVAHPEIEGVTGRTRIKQKFRPLQHSLPQMYPPKWGINDRIGVGVRADAPRSRQQAFDFAMT